MVPSSRPAGTAPIESGHDWEQLLEHTSAWVTRSVLRGIVPARPSCTFASEKLSQLPRQAAPLVVMGPHNPVHMALLASIYLLREAELHCDRLRLDVLRRAV